jgi:hypothetical protein
MRPTNPSLFTYEDKLPTALTRQYVNPGVLRIVTVSHIDGIEKRHEFNRH